MKGFLTFSIVLSLATMLGAVEINPSRRVVPEKFTNPPGKRFSIFAGDPERVQKANEVNTDDFKARIIIKQPEVPLTELQTLAQKDAPLEVLFEISNKGDRSYTLQFPDSQRYDFMIKNAADEVIYAWSEDKAFVKGALQTFVNKGDSITFPAIKDPPIKLSTFIGQLQPGDYTIHAVLANYPEVRAQATWKILPAGQPAANNTEPAE